MKFIFAPQPSTRQPTFADVGINQFFVNSRGLLCHKSTGSSYNIIADSVGSPYSDFVANVGEDAIISRILPKVAKIEF